MSFLNKQTLKMTATNFDLPSLHLLRHEIEVTLHDAEMHINEFSDDNSQAPLLLDSVDTLAQVANVLDLISLEGASTLAKTLSEGFQHLYDNREDNENDLVMDISEGIMTLNRYVEFVLLKETVEPSLLLPVINTIYQKIGKNTVELSQIISPKGRSLVIANPEQNYQSLSQLGIHNKILVEAYRAGLTVALTATYKPTNSTDIEKLNAMQSACEFVASHSDSLFWHAATAAVSNLVEALPLNNIQKRSLIFVEQQFNNYLPINDPRFADLVSFACQRNGNLAQKVKQKFSVNQLDNHQLETMKRFLFGPDREVTQVLNDLIQTEIDEIKTSSDKYARGENPQDSTEAKQDILMRLHSLSLVFQTLSLQEVSKTLKNQLSFVQTWSQPTPEDFDKLLTSLMVAENASIFMAKSHTPGAVNLPLYNQNISLHQLDTAYEQLLKEGRVSMANIESALNAYLNDEQQDINHLSNVPEMMRNISGACLFLGLMPAYQLLKRASHLFDGLLQQGNQRIDATLLAKVADVMMSVDYYLESLEVHKPAGTHAIKMGQKSLQALSA